MNINRAFRVRKHDFNYPIEQFFAILKLVDTIYVK